MRVIIFVLISGMMQKKIFSNLVVVGLPKIRDGRTSQEYSG
jgi:hypothetical protein